MATIFDGLETEIDINGSIYEVDMAFDNIMLLLEMLSDALIHDVDKIYYGLFALLGMELTLPIKEQSQVLETILKKFVHGEEEKDVPVDLEGNPMPIVKKEASYDLRHDASFIYTSFMQAYKIDLFEVRGKLDWRKFKQLLRDLPEDTKFKQVVDIRTRPYPKGKHAAEERSRLKELKRHYALPNGEVD